MSQLPVQKLGLYAELKSQGCDECSVKQYTVQDRFYYAGLTVIAESLFVSETPCSGFYGFEDII